MKKLPDYEQEEEILSDCCGVPFDEDHGICPFCKEHCERLKDEES